MNTLKRTGKRLLALLLCMTLALSLPVLPTQTASAASWVTPYLSKLQSWGVVKGDPGGAMRTESPITRAEFIAMMNRAYGYTDMGPIPFRDVSRRDWYYEDICKAYTAGIFKGTTNTTASPNQYITREQAITLLARTMRLDEIPGEIIDFTDGRQFSTYSRGYVRAAIMAGIINGYEDGTCRPLKNVTRGEAMKMLCVGIGSLINQPGTHAPGGVFGNLTINCTNVTLKDTIITGDLYISGGVSLGDVVLENVQVRGRIVVAGGGSSELGKNSVLLRGVDTKQLVVDAPTGQYISVRTEGRTHIDEGSFRSDSFLEDGCRDGYGILNVSLEGDSGDSFTLAGNLEKVINRTPNSTLILGDADASSVTVDEKAINSKLILEVNAAVDEVNLDVGTAVEGTGDIGQLTITALGTTTTMLPDKIAIRPGLNAEISGNPMNSSEAQEYSSEPRLLNGYPKVTNVAPTTADGVTSTNKRGIVYWGLTTAAMGPVPDTEEGQDRLISPSYGSGFLLSGNYPAETSNKDFTFPERLTGLTANGTYFVSAVLEDERGHRSPVYSQRFETPDDLVPAFNTGYPTMTVVETDESWVTVMANKKCDLYYVLLPRGSTTPTTNDFLAFTFMDPLGYGRVGVNKNKTESIQVNRIIYPNSTQEDKVVELDEQANYDLYLWLADADGIKNSAVTRLQFTTRDKTPPEFRSDMEQTTMGVTNIGVRCTINEPGTVYWVLVPSGTNFPVPPQGKGWTNTSEEFLRDETAKIQVRNGRAEAGSNIKAAGSIRANANVPATANITGLDRETIYDLYYVALDNATPIANYSETVKKITVYTLDSTPPTAALSFSRTAEGTGGVQPYADSDVRLEFSENILYEPTAVEPLALYNTWKSTDTSIPQTDKEKARRDLMELLPKMIEMVQVTGTSTETSVKINFENITMSQDRAGKLIITFSSGTDTTDAINMGSGCEYFFRFRDICDASPARNRMTQGDTKPVFKTVSALAVMNEITASTMAGVTDPTTPGQNKAIDIGFSITPDSTDSASAGTYWDMIMWLDTTCRFELYGRVLEKDEDSNTSAKTWKRIGDEQSVLVSTNMKEAGIGLVRITKPSQNALPFLLNGGSNPDENLKEGSVYEFALHITEMNNNTNRDTFNGLINCEVTVLTGTANNVSNIYGNLYKNNITQTVEESGQLTDITYQRGFSVQKRFSDMTAPELNNNQVTFTPGDGGVRMTLGMKDNRVGTVHYIILKDTVYPPSQGTSSLENRIPSNNLVDGVGAVTGTEADHKFKDDGTLRPNVNNVIRPSTMGNASYVSGSVPNVGAATTPEEIEGLDASTTYYCYMVTQGGSNRYSEYVYIYKFTTLPITRPVLTLRQSGSNITVQTNLASTTEINYIIVPYSEQMGSDLFNYLKASTTESGKYDAADKDTTESGAAAIGGRKYRIFETMGTGTNGSLFDQNASKTLKGDLSDYIRTQGVNNTSILGNGSGTATAGNNLVVNCSDPKFKLSPNLQYCFIAVGKSALSSATNPESYAFRAVYPFSLDDTEPPKVIDAIANVPVDGRESLRNGVFSGTVTLEFDKPLYMLYGTGINEQLRTVSTDVYNINTAPYSSNFIDANSLISNTAGATATRVKTNNNSTATPKSTSSLTLELTQATDNTVVTFDAKLCNASRHTGSTPLSITIKIVKTPNSVYDYDVQVTVRNGWQASAARTK